MTPQKVQQHRQRLIERATRAKGKPGVVELRQRAKDATTAALRAELEARRGAQGS